MSSPRSKWTTARASNGSSKAPLKDNMHPTACSLLSVTVRRLLVGNQERRPFMGRIRNDWHGIHVEIEGPETPSTKELQRMFAGGTHSSTWNPVLVQIEKLAGRFTVEKRHRRFGTDLHGAARHQRSLSLSVLPRTGPKSGGHFRRSDGIADLVTQHRDTLNAHSEGKSTVDLGINALAFNTLGSTMPQPKISSQPVPW